MPFNTCLALFVHSILCYSTLVWLCLSVLFLMKWCLVLSFHVVQHVWLLTLFIHSVFGEVVFFIVTPCHSTLVWHCLFVLFLMKWCFVRSLHVIQHLSGFVNSFCFWLSAVFYCQYMSFNTLYIQSVFKAVLFCIVTPCHSTLVWLCLFILYLMNCCFVLSLNVIPNLSCFVYSFYIWWSAVLYYHSMPFNTRLALFIHPVFYEALFCIKA